MIEVPTKDGLVKIEIVKIKSIVSINNDKNSGSIIKLKNEKIITPYSVDQIESLLRKAYEKKISWRFWVVLGAFIFLPIAIAYLIEVFIFGN